MTPFQLKWQRGTLQKDSCFERKVKAVNIAKHCVAKDVEALGTEEELERELEAIEGEQEKMEKPEERTQFAEDEARERENAS